MLATRASSRRLSGHGAPPGEWLLGDSDINLRSLHPGEGQYLPLAAMLNGTVYFTPEGAHVCKLHSVSYTQLCQIPLE